MTHLCLVSDQPVPNYLPVIDDAAEIRPTRVVLAVSASMRKKGDFLREAIERRQIHVELLDVPSPYDLHSLQDLFVGWLDRHPDEGALLNVTGGTKPMAIAAQEAFRMAGKAVFYVSIETDEVVWIDRDTPPRKIEKSLTLKSYFQIHGYTIEENRPRIPEMWQAFARELTRHAQKWEKPLAKLNWHAMNAAHYDRLDEGRIQEAWPEWHGLMEQLYHNEIIRSQDRLHFRSSEARAFCNGGWIEWLVADALRSIEGVRDTAVNLTIRDANGNRNELDAAFLSRNRLFIVECKTKRLDRTSDELHGPAAEAVYKLDALLKTGGLRTRGILVSFMPVEDRHKHRAESAGIRVIDQSRLAQLKELLASAIK